MTELELERLKNVKGELEARLQSMEGDAPGKTEPQPTLAPLSCSAALVEKLADVAWKTLNHDNDPHNGEKHNAYIWDTLCKRIRQTLKAHAKK